MQRSVACKVLHRDELAAVDLADEQDAGVHRLIDEPFTPQPPQHHRAGAANAAPSSNGLSQRPSALVTVSTICFGVPFNRVRITFSPAAGRPAAVSSTCVVIRPIRTQTLPAHSASKACSNKTPPDERLHSR